MTRHSEMNSMYGGLDPGNRLDFLSGGREVGTLMRAHGWSDAPLGSPDGWPQGLKTLVGVMLGSNQPMFIAWGPERTLLYNDAYAKILANKHPSALGRDFLEVWQEIRADLLPIVEKAYGGESVHMDHITLIMERRGYPEETHFSFSYTPVRDEAGIVAGFFCPCTEITGQVMAERRLAAETERQRRLFEQAPGFITALTGPAHVFEFVNQSYRRLFGDRGYIGRTVRDAFPELVGQGFYELLDQVYATGERFVAHHIPIRFQATPDGAVEERFLDFIYEPVLDDAGRVTGIFCEGQDVTEAHLAQALISASNERYTSMLSAMSEGFVVLDREYRLIEINAEGLRIDGRPENELLGKTHWAAFPGSVGTPVEAAYRRAMIERIPVELEHRYVDEAAGHDVWLALRIYPVSDGVAAFYRDISETKRAEEALRASEGQFRAFAQAMPNHVWTSLPNGQLDWFNDRVYEYSGASPGELHGEGWTGMVHPDDLPTAAERWAAVLSSGANYETEFRLRRVDDAYRWHIARAVPIHDDGGALVRWIGTNTDIEDQKAAGEAIRKLNVTLAEQVAERTADRDRMWRLTTDVMLVARFDATIMSVNPAWTTLLGWHEDELLGTSFLDLVHPDDLAATVAEAGRLSEGITTLRFENRYRHKDGSYRWLSWIAVPDEQFIHAVGRDVTGEKEQVQALRQAEEALRQAQKMEAVGQLTGGIAHDFNNLLTIIRSSVEFLRRPNLPEERRRRYIDSITDTVDRAAKLTGQLLAFARRQALKPEVFDVPERIRMVTDMLRTIAGSRIRIETDVACDQCFVEADVTQFETALVNMAVNARDAMEGEGTLTVHVDALAEMPSIRGHAGGPGTFVAVSITDTGSGIPADQLGQIFEPFFTTKEVGKGTGLGLSQVYGFAKQTGGDVKVESELGKGTTFTLYLPKVEREDGPGGDTCDWRGNGQHEDGRGCRVLVVEDNIEVGRFSTQLLQDLGYETIWAANGSEALKLLEEDHTRFDVVFSDVVMPGMSGVELGHELRRRYPRLPVVLTSGYSHVLAEEGRHGFELLHKPYAVEDVSRVLRRATRGPVASRAATGGTADQT